MRKSDIVTIDGESHTIGEWCVLLKISRSGLQHRVDRKGMSLEEALTTPLFQNPKRQTKKRRQDTNCVDCRYSMIVTLMDRGVWYACDYMGITGIRRPCESGDNCTVKIKRGAKHECMP